MPHFYDAATGQMCFGTALEAMRNGKRIRRKAWSAGWFVSKVMLDMCPYMNITSQDIMAQDWEELYDDPTVGQTLP